MCAARVQDIVKSDGLNLELFFVTEILKLRSLHYGYWEEAPERLDLNSVRQAQANFTERLLSHIPPGVQKILDVGSGIGDNARALAARGYIVTAISPDKNHAKYYGPSEENNITFHNVTFEDFQSEERFDLILISEALNYFDKDLGLQQCRKYLRSGGYLLITGIFRSLDQQDFADDFQLQDLPYVRQAAGYNFSLLKTVDITKNVVPTMILSSRAMKEYVRPSIEMAERYLKASGPWKLRFIKLFFAKQLRELSAILDYYQRRTAPEYFLRKIRYATLLFRGPG
jgi:SAM-dependent methyltransferase